MRATDPSIAVIGGSGLYSLFPEDESEQLHLATPYGPVSLTVGSLAGRAVAFLPRHGASHSVAPHKINYRANIWALASIGVRAIISSAAVGAVHPDYPIGSLVLVDQYIDRTHGRADTFFDDQVVRYLPSADPFCPTLRELAAASLGALTIDGATVAVIQGPRFSTRAESTWLRAAGAHLVNMTLYPEVPLAAELTVGTVTLAYVTDNDAATTDTVSADEVFTRLKAAQPHIVSAIATIAASIPDTYTARQLIDRDAVESVLARRVP